MWLSTWTFVVENLVPPGGSTKAVLGKIRPDPSLLASDPSYCRLQFSTHLFNCAPPLPTRSQAQVCVKTKFGHFTRLRNPGLHTSVWSIIAGLSHLECVMFYTFHMFNGDLRRKRRRANKSIKWRRSKKVSLSSWTQKLFLQQTRDSPALTDILSKRRWHNWLNDWHQKKICFFSSTLKTEKLAWYEIKIDLDVDEK